VFAEGCWNTDATSLPSVPVIASTPSVRPIPIETEVWAEAVDAATAVTAVAA
jgi:hypothetical protein